MWHSAKITEVHIEWYVRNPKQRNPLGNARVIKTTKCILQRNMTGSIEKNLSYSG